MSTLCGPACPDMLLNAVSVLTSVKFCFWMFDSQWEHVSNLTDRHVTVLGFLAGTGGQSTNLGDHHRRPFQENSISRLINTLIHVFFAFISTACHRKIEMEDCPAHHPVKHFIHQTSFCV